MTSPSDWPDRPRTLLSFAYFQGWSVEKFAGYAWTDLLIDSGAFTAATKGKKVDIEEYNDFLIARADSINHAASLDVIGDWRETAKNYEKQKARLGDRVDLLPTWHLGSPIEELHRLCEERDYMAIGGCVPYAKRPEMLMRHLIQAHRVAAEHGTKLHGLGITGKTAMLRLPWHSVDSSSWSAAHKFSRLTLNDEGLRPTTIQYSKRQTLADRRMIRLYGGDPSRVESPDFNLISRAGREQGTADRAWTLQASIRSYLLSEPFARRKHGTEFRLYLAMGTSQADAAIEAWRAGSPFATQMRR